MISTPIQPNTMQGITTNEGGKGALPVEEAAGQVFDVLLGQMMGDMECLPTFDCESTMTDCEDMIYGSENAILEGMLEGEESKEELLTNSELMFLQALGDRLPLEMGMGKKTVDSQIPIAEANVIVDTDYVNPAATPKGETDKAGYQEVFAATEMVGLKEPQQQEYLKTVDMTEMKGLNASNEMAVLKAEVPFAGFAASNETAEMKAAVVSKELSPSPEVGKTLKRMTGSAEPFENTENDIPAEVVAGSILTEQQSNQGGMIEVNVSGPMQEQVHPIIENGSMPSTVRFLRDNPRR